MTAEDDIGDILDEIDRNLNEDEQKQAKDVTQSLSQISRDVDDLLDITGEDATTDVRKPKHTTVRLASPSAAGPDTGKRKCQRAMVAGVMTSSGYSTAMTPRSCDNLMCLSCDFKVVSFDGWRWSEGGADYLFLRNNYPDFQRLRSQLVPDRGARAYACGCCKASPREMRDIVELNPDLKWVCMKH